MRLLTPAGPGGIAVVACEGAAEREAVEARLRTVGPDGAGGPWPALSPGAVRLAVLRVDGTDLDEVLVVAPPAGGLELHLHGSPAVLDRLARCFGELSAPAGTPAERLLATAMGREQLQLAMEQRRVDYPAFLDGLAALPSALRGPAVRAALARSRVSLALARAHRLVICGAQNAGKSTLMNRLLFAERVLAGARPGLTRDPVRESTCLGGYPYELVDTAGEGEVVDAVDRAAVDRARSLRETADRLLVVDASVGPSAADRGLCGDRTLVLASKADLPASPWPADFPRHLEVSCRDPADCTAVRRRVGERLRRWRDLPPAGPVGGPAALDAEQWSALERLLEPAR